MTAYVAASSGFAPLEKLCNGNSHSCVCTHSLRHCGELQGGERLRVWFQSSFLSCAHTMTSLVLNKSSMRVAYKQDCTYVLLQKDMGSIKPASCSHSQSDRMQNAAVFSPGSDLGKPSPRSVATPLLRLIEAAALSPDTRLSVKVS